MRINCFITCDEKYNILENYHSFDTEIFQTIYTNMPLIIGKNAYLKFATKYNGYLKNTKKVGILSTQDCSDLVLKPNTTIHKSIEDVLEHFKNHSNILIIGGFKTFELFLNSADVLFINRIKGVVTKSEKSEIDLCNILNSTQYFKDFSFDLFENGYLNIFEKFSKQKQ